eukprot:2729327-Amphidinium_carterae.2
MVKHIGEVDTDVAMYAASQPKGASRAKLSWRKTKTGRRRERQVGSGGTRSSLPTVQEEKACDAFLEKIAVAEPDECERRALHGRTILTSTLHSLIEVPGGTRNQLPNVRSNSFAPKAATLLLLRYLPQHPFQQGLQ